MKQLFFGCAALLFTTVLTAQTNTKEEAIIKQVIKEQETAWNKHDWKAFSHPFTDDGTLINFVGQFWKGRNDILANFTRLNDCCLAATSVQFNVQQIRILSPGTAIVYTEETLTVIKDYDSPFQRYKKGDVEYKIISDVFVKKGSGWKITAMQVALINQQVEPHKGKGE